METLSPDLLRHLATYLDLISLSRFFQVSKRYNSLSDNQYFWTQKLNTDYPEFKSDPTLTAKRAYYLAYYRYWARFKYTYASELGRADTAYQQAKKLYKQRKAEYQREGEILRQRLDRLIIKNMTFSYIYKKVTCEFCDDVVKNGKYGKDLRDWMENIIGQKVHNGMLIHLDGGRRWDIYFFVFEGDDESNELSIENSQMNFHFPIGLTQLCGFNGWKAGDIKRLFNIPFQVIETMGGSFLIDTTTRT